MPTPWRIALLLWQAALAALALAAAWLPRLARADAPQRLAPAGVALLVRVAAGCGLAAFAAATLLVAVRPGSARPLVVAMFSAACALCLALAAAVLALRPRWLAPSRRAALRALDAVLFNAVAVLLLAELSVALVARFSASPLLHFDRAFGSAVGERAVRENLRRFRLKPGAPFYDARINSRGFPDDEFFVAGPRDFVVGVLADSFGVGVVPPSYNFTSVAERALAAALAPRFERVAVHNFGVASISPPEYYYLLLNEALPTNPALVALCFFVGNDLGASLEQERATPTSLQGWRTYQLVRRLLALRQAPRGGAVDFTDWGRFDLGVPEWVHDHRLERPTFDERKFLDIEQQRAGECNLAWGELPARYQRACATLGEFHRVLGDRLLVVLLPDEFQVNDELWQAILRRTPDPTTFRREHPQEQLVGCCRRAGIQVLDLLPALRAAQRRAPTYHLRDTHWNAHGNRVAGEVIAAWILANRAGGGR